jgi:hypothetical protein
MRVSEKMVRGSWLRYAYVASRTTSNTVIKQWRISMETENASQDSLSISTLSGGAPEIDPGTYVARYDGLKVFMDNTPWGEKKAARIYFKVAKGQFTGQRIGFKGHFFQNDSNGQWVVGSKSKLAEVIRTVTGGNDNLTRDHVGTPVFISVVEKTAKTSNKTYILIDKVMPVPSNGGTPRPAAAKSEDKPAEKVTAGKKSEDNNGLLDDLTDLSDFGD